MGCTAMARRKVAGAAQQFFVFVGAVHVGRVEEGEAQLQGAGALGIVRTAVEVGHAHAAHAAQAAQAQSRNREAGAAQLAGFYGS